MLDSIAYRRAADALLDTLTCARCGAATRTLHGGAPVCADHHPINNPVPA